nr:single-stranded DNA-binding protein [Terrimonas ferruginea]
MWREKLIENAKNHFIKGSHVLVDGRISYSKFKDKVGHAGYMTEINAKYIVGLDR